MQSELLTIHDILLSIGVNEPIDLLLLVGLGSISFMVGIQTYRSLVEEMKIVARDKTKPMPEKIILLMLLLVSLFVCISLLSFLIENQPFPIDPTVLKLSLAAGSVYQYARKK